MSASGDSAPAPITRDPNPGFQRALLHASYDLLWTVALAVFAPWFLIRAVFDRTFRRMAIQRLSLSKPPPVRTRPRILIHGVSVGEVKGAAPLVHALRASEPELEIVVSATTETGLEVARQLFPDTLIARFPIDLSPCVARFLRRIDPMAVVLIELEIWPNFLRQCNLAGMPISVVNGRITAASFDRYRLFRSWLPQFNRISLFCVQTEEYAQRFRDLGGEIPRVLVTGNMKADGLLREPSPELLRKVAELRALLGPRPEQLVVVAGSTHHPEEQMFARACRAALPDARLVIVPRHPARVADVVRDLEALGAGAQLLTALRRGEAQPDPARPAVVDTIGELEAVYRLADLVFVGGSLVDHGGQNVLEPAAQGLPVVFGPHVDNFRTEAALLETAGAALRVADGEELARTLERLGADRGLRARMGEAGRGVVAAQMGATQLTLQALHDRCLEPCGTAELGRRRSAE